MLHATPTNLDNLVSSTPPLHHHHTPTSQLDDLAPCTWPTWPLHHHHTPTGEVDDLGSCPWPTLALTPAHTLARLGLHMCLQLPQVRLQLLKCLLLVMCHLVMVLYRLVLLHELVVGSWWTHTTLMLHLLHVKLLLKQQLQLLARRVWGQWRPGPTRPDDASLQPRRKHGRRHCHGRPQAWRPPTMQVLHLHPTWAPLDHHHTLTPLLLLTRLQGVMLLLLLRCCLGGRVRGQVLTAAQVLPSRDLIRHGAQLLTGQQHHPHELMPPAKLCCCDASPRGNHHPAPLILS